MKDRDSGVSSAGASQGTEKDDIIFDQILRLLHREVCEKLWRLGALGLNLLVAGRGARPVTSG